MSTIVPPPGIEKQARSLPLFLLADVSGSMSQEGKITQLNLALREFLEDLRTSAGATAGEVLLTLITFSDSQKVICKLTPVSSVVLPTLTTDSATNLAPAIRAILPILDDTATLQKCLVPVVVLLSDGQPQDTAEWTRSLQEMLAHPRGRRADRIALAIGGDADLDMLRQFASPEVPVLRADEAHKLKGFFKWLTISLTSKGQTQGKTGPAQMPPPDDLVVQ